MFAKKTDEKSGLNDAIDKLLTRMSNVSSTSEEYTTMVDHLTKLYALKEQPKRVSPDTMATVLGNLIGIVLIVGHERAHVITSKALLFVQKLK